MIKKLAELGVVDAIEVVDLVDLLHLHLVELVVLDVYDHVDELLLPQKVCWAHQDVYCNVRVVFDDWLLQIHNFLLVELAQIKRWAVPTVSADILLDVLLEFIVVEGADAADTVGS